MRVIVTGSRTYGKFPWHQPRLEEVLGELPRRGLVIVNGGAKGADLMAQDWARSRRVRLETHRVLPEEWALHGKAAGPMRNRRMAELGADRCLAFWNGVSPGTKDMIEQARAFKIPVEIYFHGPGAAAKNTLPLF